MSLELLIYLSNVCGVAISLCRLILITSLIVIVILGVVLFLEEIPKSIVKLSRRVWIALIIILILTNIMLVIIPSQKTIDRLISIRILKYNIKILKQDKIIQTTYNIVYQYLKNIEGEIKK